MPSRISFPVFVLAAGVLAASVVLRPAHARETVDLELVLAVDVSGSIDEEEAILQRKGYIDALNHPQVLAAIKAGYHGRIAVIYIEWAGDHYQKLVADWTVIGDAAGARKFTDAVAKVPVTVELWTSISGAIAYTARLFDPERFSSKRRVIDISGDGPNNRGENVTVTRDMAVRMGITINGLAIVNDRPSRYGMMPMSNLDYYYEDCVIGGRGAFVVVAESFADFARAVRRKLILEIAGYDPEPRHAGSDARLLHFVADGRPKARRNEHRPPCDYGERRRRDMDEN